MPSLFNIDRKTTSSLIVAVLAVCALGTSCSEEFEGERFQQTDRMSFDVSISNKWNIAKTRSAEQNGRTVTSEKIENSDLWLITTVEDNPDTTLFERPKVETRATPYDFTGISEPLNPLDNFGVYAWTYTGEDWENAADKSLYINGDEVTSNESSNLWSTKDVRYWPGNDYKMRFFAYAPHKLTKNENSLTIDPNNCTPIIKYTTAPNARNQEDLLVALDQPIKEGLLNLTQVEGNYNRPLGLEFRHILTAVNVQASDALGRTITSIKFTGIKQSGTYKLENGEWVLEPTDGAVEISCDNLEKNLTSSTDSPVDVIADKDGTTFMMIPQELTDAKIEVTLSDGTKSETLTATLTNTWQVGTRVTYKISLTEWEYEFDVKPLRTSFTYAGTTESTPLFEVKSYRRRGESETEQVGYTVEYSIDDGEWTDDPSAVFSGLTSSKNDGVFTYSAAVNAQVNSAENFHTITLKGNLPLGDKKNDEPYDLSQVDNIRRTANCYMVHAQGYYSFPLVYGNAIDQKINGVSPFDNANAYTEATEIKNVLGKFVNHKNDEITNPYIAKNEGCKPVDAVLVWQDAPGLVTNIELQGSSAETYKVVFDVAESTIHQGNAIIAVRGGTKNADGTYPILWSWHIWVTDYVPTSDKLKTFTSHLSTGSTYQLMDYNLGWCDGDTVQYKERTVYVRVTPEVGEAKTFAITQSSETITTTGNHPYYQWGRKDPMLPSTGSSKNKTSYASAYQFDERGVGPVSIGTSIQNPNVFYNHGGLEIFDWCNTTYYNLWNTSQSNTLVNTMDAVKSIYDPCPAGFQMPVVDVFCAFTKSGSNASDVPNIYGDWDLENNGWTFQDNRNGTTGDETFFPALGCRDSNFGVMENVGSRGYYWSAVPFGQSTGRYLNFESGYVHPRSNSSRSYGFAVRPVKE